MDLGQRSEFICFLHHRSRLLDQVDCVLDETSLDIVVNLADVVVSEVLLFPFVVITEVDVQAWVIIDLQDPCLEVSVNHEVESKDLERLSSDIKLVSHGSDLLLNEGTVDLHSLSTSFCNTLFDLLDIDPHLGESLIK